MADKQILVLNNQRLAVQLEEKKKEHKLLESKVETYEQRQQDYADTLLSINRIWTQLEGDIQHLANAAVGALGPDPAPSPSDGAAAGPGPSSLALAGASAAAVAAGQRDPYLLRLLQGAPGPATKDLLDTHKQLEADMSNAEEVLLDRARVTKTALAKVLEKVQGLKASQQRLGEQLAASTSGSGTEALKADFQRLSSEAAAQRRELDLGRAGTRAAQQELLISEDRQLQAEQRIKKLQNELADAEQEASTLRRKCFALSNKSANNLEAAGMTPGMTPQPSGSVPPTPYGRDGGGASANGTPRAGSGAAPSAAASTSGHEASEVAELQALLASRTAELDKEREEHIRLSRELQDALSRVNDESWVPSTKVFQITSRQVQQLTEQLAARQKEAEGLARERDDAQREAHTRSQVYLSEALATNRLHASQAAFRDLQSAKADSDRQRQELQVVLQRERDKLGTPKTVSELKLMIATLQQELLTLQQHGMQNKATMQRLQAAVTAAQEAARVLQAREQEVVRLRDALRRRDGELDELALQQQPLREQVADLRAFVEVFTAVCEDLRDAAALRASEASLRLQVAALKTQLEGHPLQQRVHELDGAVRAGRDQHDLLAMAADELRLQVGTAQRAQAEVEGQLAAARAECELYISEVETTSQAYEDMQSQNTRLLQQLTERDDANNQLTAERLKLHQAAAVLQEQLAAGRAEHDRLQRELSDAGNVREATDKEVARIAQELVQTKELLRGAIARGDSFSQDVKRRDDSLAQVTATSTSYQRNLTDTKAAADETAGRLVKESAKRQRLEEENQALQTKVEKARKAAALAVAAAGSNGEDSSEARAVQQEVDAMRALLNCNVCHERQKNTIIVKCGHVFCDRCVKNIVDARSRKCPGCGAGFASSDVKPFFFT